MTHQHKNIQTQETKQGKVQPWFAMMQYWE